MSRAKEDSRVYVVADSMEQATEDLAREWGTDRRLGWAIDTGTPLTDPLEAEASPAVARPMRHALRRVRLVAERDAILAVAPTDPSARIRAAELRRRRLEAERGDLAEGTGRYRDHPVARALGELRRAESNVARLERNISECRSRKERRAWRSGLEEWRPKLAGAARDFAELTASELARLEREERGLQQRLGGLWSERETYHSWVARHPEAERRLDHLAGEIDRLDQAMRKDAPAHERAPALAFQRMAQLGLSRERSLGLELEICSSSPDRSNSGVAPTGTSGTL